MAAAAPAALTLPDWQNTAKVVEELASAAAVFASTSAEFEAAVNKTTQAANKLDLAAGVPMTNATWRKMLTKQVPQQLATACTRVLHNTLLSSSSNSSSGSGSTSTSSRTSTVSAAANTALSTPCTAAAAVLQALEVLTHRAQADLFLGPATGFGQQIEQSGFLQLLPQLFASLVERLQAETGLITQLKPVSQPSASGSSSSSTQRQHRATGIVFNTAYMLTEATTSAMRSYARLAFAWPTAVFVTEVVPGCTEAALQLCWLIFQQVSEQLPPPGTAQSTRQLGSAADHLAAAVAAARTAFEVVALDLSLAACSRNSLTQLRARVLASPYALPCQAFLLTVGVYASLLAQLHELPRLRAAAGNSSSSSSAGAGRGNSRGSSAQATGGSSSGSGGSSSSGSSSSSGLSGPAAAWEVACKQLASVPSAHRMLLQQLGCSPLAALFCAAVDIRDINTGQQPSSSSSSSSNSARHVARADNAAAAAGVSVVQQQHTRHLVNYNHFLAATPTTHAPASGPSAVAPTTSTAEHQLHLLLSPVLFYWAAHQPAHLPGGAPADCHRAVLAGRQALLAANLDQRGLVPAVPDWLLQLVRAEMTPLISVLGSRGCTSTPGSTASSSGSSTSSGSSSSSSSSSSQPSKRSTATSAAPGRTVMHLAMAFDLLRATEQLPLLCAQLLEAAVRGWQQSDFSINQNLASMQRLMTALMLLRCSSGGGSSGSSNPTSLYLRGPLLAAAQVQGCTTDSDPLSPEQLQLASLCCSVLKALPAACEADPSLHNALILVECCQLVAVAANNMLHWLAAATESAAGGSSTQHAVAAAAPWLVLSGRVLQFVAPLMTPAATLQGAAGLQEFFSNSNSNHSYWLRQSAHIAIAGLRVWLQAEGAADALSAAGYNPSGSVLQQLQAACGAAESTGSLHAADALELPEPETLQSLSQALSTLPFACACNNPVCTNLAGPRELQLVNGKSCKCSSCRVARYCSRACQVQHWPAHKPVCKAAAAARQAASAGAATARAAAQPQPLPAP